MLLDLGQHGVVCLHAVGLKAAWCHECVYMLLDSGQHGVVSVFT
jgi:hypothetical protein